ncbi:MAG: SDR family NAD(P)-dependent oxidoreductase [Alistipes sp.]
MLRLHVRTTTLLCHYFGRSMQARGRGYILNMSSMSAWMPFPGISVYAATKSYLRTLSLAIRNELYDRGVRVTAVCPGAVATGLYNLSERYQRLALRLGIMMTPERLARKGCARCSRAAAARCRIRQPHLRSAGEPDTRTDRAAHQAKSEILPLWTIRDSTS